MKYLKKCSPPSVLISVQLHRGRWRGLLASGRVHHLPLPDLSLLNHCALPSMRLASEREEKQSVSGNWFLRLFCLYRKGGVKRLVVSASSAMSVAWVSVSYYTNEKLVKKDLCIASNYFCFFPLALLSYLTHTKTICKELEECPSHNSPLCGEVTAVLVIQLNETAEHDSGSIKKRIFKKRKKRCRTLYFS